MTLHISFDISDSDLEQLAALMQQSREKAGQPDPESIRRQTREKLSECSRRQMPDFMRQRFDRLERLVDMVEDDAWQLPEPEHQRVLDGLAYFVLTEDLIPDDLPALGFLDDAIKIWMVSMELRHELEAYEDFCSFREAKIREGIPPAEVSRPDWLVEKRESLMGRMRVRRKLGGKGWLALR